MRQKLHLNQNKILSLSVCASKKFSNTAAKPQTNAVVRFLQRSVFMFSKNSNKIDKSSINICSESER